MNGHVFLDASFWIAYRDERQDLHAQARRILSEIFRRRLHFVTTLPILCEIQAHFSRNEKRKAVILRDFDANPLVQIEAITHADQQDAFELLRQHADKTYSLCDAISFVVIQRLGLKRALSFDDHFRQFGKFEIFS
jgi:predicted nucleic acid-binding protein